MKIEHGEQVSKVRRDFIVEDLITLENNAKAKKFLMCGLGMDEYNRVLNCTVENKCRMQW